MNTYTSVCTALGPDRRHAFLHCESSFVALTATAATFAAYVFTEVGMS